MKNQATYDDANLILKLYELRREEKLREARKWFGTLGPFRDRAHWLEVCPPGFDTNAYYRMVTTYWDMAASFVTSGVLNAELFYRANNLELLVIWEKIKNVVPEVREVNHNPLTLRNMEQVANGFIEFMNANAPGAYETLAANIAKMGK